MIAYPGLPFPSSESTQRDPKLGSQCSLAQIGLQTVFFKGFREGRGVIYPRGAEPP
jgi:hypothetical protein